MAEKKSKLSKIIILALLAVVVTTGIVYGAWQYYQYSHYVETDDAKIEGNITAVSAKISGKVAKLMVSDGDSVKNGQLLLELDPIDVQNQKKQASAALMAARAKASATQEGARIQDIQQAQAGVDATRAFMEKGAIDFHRAELMIKEGAIPQSKYDEAKANYLAFKSAYDFAMAKLDLAKAGARSQEITAATEQAEQAEGALDAVNTNLGYVKIFAPDQGFIGMKAVNPGEVVAAGQPLLYIADLTKVWIKANIEENYLYRLKEGQTVEFTIDAYPGKLFCGKLEKILPAAQSAFALIPTENVAGSFTKVTQRVPVKISVPADAGVTLRPGMSVHIKILAPL